MFQFFIHLSSEHDWRLVLLAAALCLLASAVAISLFHRASATTGRNRLLWLILDAATTGYGIWATHFVAMLAYNPAAGAAYDLTLTIVSLFLAVAITGVGFAVAVYGDRRFLVILGGAIVGLGIASMHPLRGMILPDDFVPLAEETGLIVPIGDWVLRRACMDAAKWPASISVAVNLSPMQFKNRMLSASVISALSAADLPAERLELEITESVLLQDNASTLATLHALRDFGVRISMDDFGTGYSSLSYLRSFPFDKIKIDRSFVRDLASHGDSMAIVRAVTGLGKSLRITTLAEGVETDEQLALLRAEGCTQMQGYFFGRPQPASEIVKLLSSQRLDNVA